MAKQLINLGTTADDGTGDPPRTAGQKINDNANELYAGYYIQVPLTTPGGTLTAGDELFFDFPFAGTVTKFEVKAQTAPTTSAATFDLNRNAAWGTAPTSILTADLSLAAGAFEAADSSIATPTVTAGDVGSVIIASVDSGATCADAVAIIHVTRT